MVRVSDADRNCLAGVYDQCCSYFCTISVVAASARLKSQGQAEAEMFGTF